VNYIVSPKKVVSVLNTYRLFLLRIIPLKIQDDNSLHSTNTVLSILSNLEMILSIWEDGHKLYANTTLFFMREGLEYS
jgi:hypothetical protein